MAVQFEINQELLINGTLYRVSEHPAAPWMPYGQEGRQAIVYKLSLSGQTDEESDNNARALKVFKPRFQFFNMGSHAAALAAHAGLPGLTICRREVLDHHDNETLICQYPGLACAFLLPWLEGPTWMEVMLEKKALKPGQSLFLAKALLKVLATMERRGIAHCDISSPNVLLPGLLEVEGFYQPVENGQSPVALVDVEQLFCPELSRPELLPGGSPGYAHKTACTGVWEPCADRFAGAVLLAEVLCWCDEKVMEAAWGESYFDPGEMQRPTARYRILVEVLKKRWGHGAALQLERAWSANTLADCPAFSDWLAVLPEEASPANTKTIRSVYSAVDSSHPERLESQTMQGPVVQELSGSTAASFTTPAKEDGTRLNQKPVQALSKAAQEKGKKVQKHKIALENDREFKQYRLLERMVERLRKDGNYTDALEACSQAKLMVPAGSALGRQLSLLIREMEDNQLAIPAQMEEKTGNTFNEETLFYEEENVEQEIIELPETSAIENKTHIKDIFKKDLIEVEKEGARAAQTSPVAGWRSLGIDLPDGD